MFHILYMNFFYHKNIENPNKIEMQFERLKEQ